MYVSTFKKHIFLGLWLEKKTQNKPASHKKGDIKHRGQADKPCCPVFTETVKWSFCENLHGGRSFPKDPVSGLQMWTKEKAAFGCIQALLRSHFYNKLIYYETRLLLERITKKILES